MAVRKYTDEQIRFALDYAGPSPRQRSIAEARLAGMTMKEYSADHGVSERVARDSLRALMVKAARIDGAPEAAPGGVIPAGYSVKGKSHMMRDADGNPVWVKTETDREARMQAYVDAIESAAEGIKPISPIKAPRAVQSDLLNLYHFTDYHLGMYAWAAETGEDWDTGIAKSTFATALAEMLEHAPEAETGIFSQGGDFCHWDGWDTVTPMNKHLLDADTRFPLLAETALDMHIHAIERLLTKHKSVVAIIQEGNHDMASSVWIRKAMIRYFAKNKRVTIDDTETPFYAYQHGNFLIGFHHGHKIRNRDLPRMFASDPRFREMWGRCEYAYLHCGHYHKYDEWGDEYAGGIVERHPTLAARDAYAARGGYVSKRAANAITYHKTLGERSRFKVVPPRN